MSAPTIKLGDIVTWDSQAAGTWMRKTGTVVEVVPPRRCPATYGSIARRDHESYVVEVPGKTARAASTRYWPIASKLRERERVAKLGKRLSP